MVFFIIDSKILLNSFMFFQDQAAQLKAAEEAAKQSKQHPGGLLSFLYTTDTTETEGSMEFSLAGLFKCMCCVHNKPDEKAKIATTLEAIQKRLESIEK